MISILKPSYWIQLSKDTSFLKDLALSLCSWLILALAFPPLPLGQFSWVALVPWMIVLKRNGLKRSLGITFFSAFVYNAIQYYWIYYVMNAGPGPIVLFGLVCLITYLSMMSVVCAWAFKALQNRSLLMLFPIFWAGIEVLRTKGELSFPWSHLGYALGDSLPMIQVSAWIGVFGMSILVMYANLFGLKFWETKSKKYLAQIWAFPLILLAIGWITLENTKEPDEFIDAVVVQPNLIQENKWKRQEFQTNIDQTWETMNSISLAGADLIVFPETAFPAFMNKIVVEREKLKQIAKQTGAQVVTGALDFIRVDEDWGKYKYKNTAFIFNPDGTIEKYDKIRLVPFSERLPFDDVLPLLNYVDFGEGDFSPGQEQKVFTDKNWAPNICYETIYPYFIRNLVDKGARVIVNMTNDGWFKDSTEPRNHLSLTRFRAVENGMPIIRSTNTGISAFIDGYGRILARAKIFESDAIRARIGLKVRTTLYSKIGGLVEWSLFLSLFAFLIMFWVVKPYDD